MYISCAIMGRWAPGWLWVEVVKLWPVLFLGCETILRAEPLWRLLPSNLRVTVSCRSVFSCSPEVG